MKDYDFENVTEKIITILKILLLVIFSGIGLGTFTKVVQKKNLKRLLK